MKSVRLPLIEYTGAMQQCTALFFLPERSRTMNEFKFENPYEIELRVKMDAETHKQLVQFCTERHTTRAEVVRKLINELLKESKKSK